VSSIARWCLRLLQHALTALACDYGFDSNVTIMVVIIKQVSHVAGKPARPNRAVVDDLRDKPAVDRRKCCQLG